jgi:hypothetical protein
MHRLKLAVAVMALTASISPPAFSQTATPKDIQAYNYVFDRLKQIFPDIPTERIHILNVMVPATWAADDDNDANWELQTLAGAIPPDEFSLDPSRMKLRLDQVYSNYINDMVIPPQDPTRAANLQQGMADFTAAQTDFDAVKVNWDALWKTREDQIKASGRAVRTSDRQAFQVQHGAMFAKVLGEFRAATKKITDNADINGHFINDAQLMLQTQLGVFANGDGIYSYKGGQATLRALKDCDDAKPDGWETLTFDQNTNSQNLRSSSWNANGGWSSGFFGASVGGGHSNFDNLIKTSSDSISLQFCNLTYIHLDPGPWFDPTLLQAVDSGSLKLKPGSQYDGKPTLGKNGTVSQFIKGAIVARRIRFMASSDASELHDIQQTTSAGGGFSIGGWGIGGHGGSVKFDHEYTSQAGSYGRSSNMTVPVIIAIVTEPSQGSGDAPPAAAAPAQVPASGH